MTMVQGVVLVSEYVVLSQQFALFTAFLDILYNDNNERYRSLGTYKFEQL
jgi:hypothetical protein